MEESSLIYGLEFQARALTSQQCESDIIRFMVGTQSLKLNQNQVHIIQENEENRSLSTAVCSHPYGEIWHISASPGDPDIISTTYNTLTEENICILRSAFWKIKENKLNLLLLLPTQQFGHEIKQTLFHTTDPTKALSIIDNKYVIWDLNESEAKVSCSNSLEGKGHPQFTCGKWNPHHNVTQIVTSNDSHVKGWDIKTNKLCWTIENAHTQLVRDLDFNPNRQYYLATCGDDGFTKFWDIRNTTEPIISRSDHSHWVWAVRYNYFHDQLVLTSSSDSQVILVCVPTISSEPGGHVFSGEENIDSPKKQPEEGVLATYEEHEDSVYAVEWSTGDPWTFASLSYDGRLFFIDHNGLPIKAVKNGRVIAMAADSDGESTVGFFPPVVCPLKFIEKGTTRSHSTGSALSWGVTEKETLSDNDLIQTVFTCQGDLGDPDFPKKFSLLLDKLSTLLCTGKEVSMKVNKVEPWNSVRVTLTIPRDAAQRLRTLAQAGDAALQALGILSVQVEGDRLISLRLATRFGAEPQEIVLRTGGETSNSFASNGGTVSVENSLGHIVPGTGSGVATAASAGFFRSPNVVAPSGVKLSFKKPDE